MNKLIHEYELFKIKHEKNTQDMKKCCIHIMNHMRTPDQSFQNKDLVIKSLRCLNCNWQPKVTMIHESKNMSSTDLATLFEKL